VVQGTTGLLLNPMPVDRHRGWRRPPAGAAGEQPETAGTIRYNPSLPKAHSSGDAGP